ncbi:beta-N-acetylhexosaminidase [Streptosporangium minutum]|uniref:beta-N-acetylhexosaminidase n=1 Tax=Streptosporangium minutum TaxID=569862 RepID=UPI000A368C02|nr:beta-N-acetylhexosaminidase [Streptosporangium minutum]
MTPQAQTSYGQTPYGQTPDGRTSYGLIPLPSSVRPGSGEFTLTAGTALDAPPELYGVAAWLRSALGPATGCALLPSAAGAPSAAGIDGGDGAGANAEHTAGGEGRIVLALGPGLAAEEFRLRITPSGVRITGGDAAGVFYGAQTFRLLLPPAALRRAPVAGGPLTVPATEIEDRPRYGWRGCMLDVARHFMPKADLLRFIDLLALHRLNVLHLHLTDDQGWRVEIAKYPRLTSVGSWRSSSMLGSRQHETFLPRPHGGFYTADDVREIVAYAAERYVTVVPEIDLPGHTQAAVAAYPWLAPQAADGPKPADGPEAVDALEVAEGAGPIDGTGPEGGTGPVGVRAAWGLSPHCLDVTSAAALDFCRDVLDEVMELFPGSHVGIGGDECPGDARSRAAFVTALAEHVTGRGRVPYAWDEILECGAVPGVTVAAWRGPDAAVVAARAGHQVVSCPDMSVYLDYRQSELPDEPIPVGPPLSLQDVHAFDPEPAGLTAGERSRVIGAQCNVWTEHMDSPRAVDYMVFPRLCAFAEVVWSADRAPYPDFARRLEAHTARLDALGVEYRPAAGPHPWQSRPDAPGWPISKARREAMVAEFGVGKHRG